MAAASSSSTGSPPSQDAIASLITQVSPTGQPARAPSRPVRPRQGQPKKAATNGTKKTVTKSKEGAAAADSNDTAADAEVAPANRTRQLTDNATARESTSGTEETAAGTTESSSNTVTGNQLMYPAPASEATSTPPSTAQSSKQRPSSQDISSTSPKLGRQQSTTAHKPNQLQKGAPATSSPSNTATMQKKKTKRKSWISSLFSSCFTGGSGHDTDDDGEVGNTMTERKAGTANATKPLSTGAAGTTSTVAAGQNNDLSKKDVAMVSLAKGDNRNDSVTKLGHPTDSTAGTGTTSSRDISSSENTGHGGEGGIVILPTSNTASSGLVLPPKPEIAPEVLAASQAGGTPLSRDETGDVLSGAVQAPGSEGLTPKKEKRRKSSSGERSTDGAGLLAGASAGDISRVSSLGTSSQESGDEDDDAEDEEAVDESEEEEYIDEEERIIAAGGMGIPIDENGNPAPLLKELTPAYKGKKCLVLDLDETLVHSSFKLIHSPDFVVPVEIENQVHNVYVIKRPGVDDFMKRMGELYEVVVFTASLSKYADPVLDQLDIHHVVEHRLFRESCYNHRGNYVKDLSQLGRLIGDTIIIDNSPASYIFHPNNAVPVSSWFNDPHDTELTDLQGFLADLAEVPDVRGVLDGGLFPMQ